MKRTTLGFVILCLAGCGGSAKIHTQDLNGGVLVLDGAEDKAYEDARAKMSQHCGPRGYQVVKQERVAVGTENYRNTNTDYEEQQDRQRDEATVAAASSQSHTAHDSESGVAASSDSAYGPHGESHDMEAAGYETSDTTTTSDSVAASATSEDETTLTQGNQQTQEVSGTRTVYEKRVHYRCGQA